MLNWEIISKKVEAKKSQKRKQLQPNKNNISDIKRLGKTENRPKKINIFFFNHLYI